MEKQKRIKQFEPKKKYQQNGPAYNEAQMNEKVYVLEFLDELLDYMPFPEIKIKPGRKPFTWKEKLTHVILQAYNTKSSRRSIGDLKIAQKLNYLPKAPHFNSLLKTLNDPETTKWLQHLINISGLPLKHLEQDLAIDSSGIGSNTYMRWFDIRIGRNNERKSFKKIHIASMVNTNIISSAIVTEGTSADGPQFQPLIKQTKKVYDIKEVSADMAYSSKNNLNFASENGILPFIPFKKNVTGKSRGSFMWSKMYKYFKTNPEEFYKKYHKRSNSETVFHMIKTKFGKSTRCINITAQINEILAICAAHNLCVLIQEMYEHNLVIDFRKCAEIPLHIITD